MAALLVLLACAAFVLGAVAPANAHAILVGTDPAEGAVLAEAPEQVTFTFNESVLGVPEGVRVFDAEGEEVASSARVSGSQLVVDLEEEVGTGTLVVVWRLVSEDGHPIGGSLRFSVGAPSATVAEPPVADVDADAPWVLNLVRWAGYLGLLSAAGLVWFAVVLLPGQRRVVVLARAAAVVTVVSWVVALPLAASYQLGETWAALPWMQYVATALVVLGVSAAVALMEKGWIAVALAAVAAVAPALTGHTRAATPELLVIGVDMLHLLAGSVWLGGLLGLACTLRVLVAQPDIGGEVLARFSGYGAAVLLALAATGTVLAWRIVGSWSNLVDTGYGQLLLVKIGVALGVVAVAAWNRQRLLPALQEATRRNDREAATARVVRAVSVEAGLLVGVLLVTGVLVDKSPEPTASAAPVAGPAVSEGALGEVSIRATLSPAATGPAVVTVEMSDAAGAPFEGYAAPVLSLASGDVDLGEVPVTSIAPGVYSSEVVIPTPGTWQLQVSLRTTEFDNPVTTVEFGVEG